MQEYATLKKKFRVMEKQSSKKIKKLEAELRRTKNELKSAMESLSKQQKSVVYPLIGQVNDKEQQTRQLDRKIERMRRQLKIIHSVIRIPRLCDLFHKAERKRLSEKQINLADQQAHLVLRQYKVDDDASAEPFIEELALEVYHELARGKKATPNVASSNSDGEATEQVQSSAVNSDSEDIFSLVKSCGSSSPASSDQLIKFDQKQKVKNGTLLVPKSHISWLPPSPTKKNSDPQDPAPRLRLPASQVPILALCTEQDQRHLEVQVTRNLKSLRDCKTTTIDSPAEPIIPLTALNSPGRSHGDHTSASPEKSPNAIETTIDDSEKYRKLMNFTS